MLQRSSDLRYLVPNVDWKEHLDGLMRGRYTDHLRQKTSISPQLSGLAWAFMIAQTDGKEIAQRVHAAAKQISVVTDFPEAQAGQLSQIFGDVATFAELDIANEDQITIYERISSGEFDLCMTVRQYENKARRSGKSQKPGLAQCALGDVQDVLANNNTAMRQRLIEASRQSPFILHGKGIGVPGARRTVTLSELVEEMPRVTENRPLMPDGSPRDDQGTMKMQLPSGELMTVPEFRNFVIRAYEENPKGVKSLEGFHFDFTAMHQEGNQGKISLAENSVDLAISDDLLAEIVTTTLTRAYISATLASNGIIEAHDHLVTEQSGAVHACYRTLDVFKRCAYFALPVGSAWENAQNRALVAAASAIGLGEVNLNPALG